MKAIFATLALPAILLIGCATGPSAPEVYASIKDQVRLGMSRASFNELMRPVSDSTRSDLKRSDETYTENGSVVDIAYIRSSLVRDGVVTDDEYTPWVFRDGVLVAFGWRPIGGMKLTSADVIKAQAKATKEYSSKTLQMRYRKRLQGI